MRALDGGVCPRSLREKVSKDVRYLLPQRYDYGIGCAFVEKNLAGLEGKAGLVG